MDFMSRATRMAAIASFASALMVAPALAKGPQSEARIRDEIIRQSIASYPGNCPCPYNTASNGSRCGKRSAWNRAGGYAPKCFADDVTGEDMKLYRASRN